MARCEIEPLPNQQFCFRIDRQEVTRWHFGPAAPRPFFWPVQLVGSSRSLTRMGHPGAPNHDHHRSLWFAHHAFHGIDFWSEQTAARIEQTQWYCIEESDEAGTLAVELQWRDGHDPSALLKQDVIAQVRPLEDRLGWWLYLQSSFKPQAEGLAFHRSNFGVLGLRVAKSLSVVFGEGRITGADGAVGEAQLFGRPNRWIDYSAPLTGADGRPMQAGLTLIDAASNPGHGSDPCASWHVRDDGWIGPSLSRHDEVPLGLDQQLVCRYGLVVHPGPCQPELANRLADQLDAMPVLGIAKASRSHRQWQIVQTSGT